MKKTIHYPRFCSYASAVLLLILIVAQFLPFWQCSNCATCGEAGMISISDYVWAPEHHESFTQSVVDQHDGAFRVADAVLPHVLILAFGILSIIFGLKDVDKPIGTILALVAGFAGTLGYALIPSLQLGLYWAVHQFLSILVLHFGLSSLTYQIIGAWEKKINDPDHQEQVALRKLVREQKKQKSLSAKAKNN